MFLEYESGYVLSASIYVNAFGPKYQNIARWRNIAIASITIALYVASLTFVGYRYFGTKWENKLQRSNWSKKINLSAFKTMMTVGFIYILCYGLGLFAYFVR